MIMQVERARLREEAQTTCGLNAYWEVEVICLLDALDTAETELNFCQEILEREMHIKDKAIDDVRQAERERDALVNYLHANYVPHEGYTKDFWLAWARQEASRQKDTP